MVPVHKGKLSVKMIWLGVLLMIIAEWSGILIYCCCQPAQFNLVII